jgi:predicted CXXCH cytochrome family protein
LCCTAGWIAIVFLWGSVFPAEAQTKATDEGYLSAKMCAGCHRDAVVSWRAGVHRKLDPRHPKGLWEKGCQVCHGADEAHLEAAMAEEKDLKIKELAKVPAKDYNDVCMACHVKDLSRSHWDGSLHAARGLSCRDCHQIHQPNGQSEPHLLKHSPQAFASMLWNTTVSQVTQHPQTLKNGVCLSCHPQQQAHFRLNSRHPVFEGRMTCTDCHNPHGGDETTHLSQRADDLCARCHTDKRGPFLYAHDMTGAGDGCQTCHQSHGSPNAKLIKLNGRALCLQCHSDISVEPQHQLRPGSCWRSGCHSDLHGSQTSRFFLRNGGQFPNPQRVLGQRSFAASSPYYLGTFTGETPVPRISRFPALSSLWNGTASVPFLADGGKEPVENSRLTGAEGGMPTKMPAVKPFEFESVSTLQNLGAEGNLSKYDQYNVKPDGLFSDLWRVKVFDVTGLGIARAQWTGADEPRQTSSVRVDLPRAGLLRFDYDRALFFAEPSLNPVAASERKNQSLLLRFSSPKEPAKVGFILQSQRVTAPGINRLTVGVTPGMLDYHTSSGGAELIAPLGTGNLYLQFLSESFDDRTQYLPRAHSAIWQMRYHNDITARTSAFASLSSISTRQSGLSGNARNIRTQAGITTNLRRNLTASVRLDATDVDLPNTLNAFVQDNDSMTVRLRYRPKSRLTLEGGYERVNLQRVNNLHTLIENPRWDGGWLSVRATPHDNVSLFARRRIRRLTQSPSAAIPGLASDLPLFADEDDRTDARIAITLPRNALFYLNYGNSERDNAQRQIGSRLKTLDVGVALPLNKHLSLNADWSRQDWTGWGEPLTTDPLNLNLGRRLSSDGKYVNLGLAYVSKDTLTANLYRFTSSGGESVEGRGVMLGYERRLTDLISARLVLGWDDYNDNLLPGFNNSDKFIRLDLIRRF